MKKLAIGVDIGGINTAFGLVDENGDLYAESVISTKKYPYVDDYPAYVEELCDSLRALSQSPVVRVRTGRYRHRGSECQFPQGDDRDPGESVEVP